MKDTVMTLPVPRTLTSDEAPLWDRNSFAPEAWTETLSTYAVTEIIDALTVAQHRLAGRDLVTDRVVSRDDFPLTNLAPRLEAMAAEVADGRGFAVLRGLP